MTALLIGLQGSLNRSSAAEDAAEVATPTTTPSSAAPAAAESSSTAAETTDDAEPATPKIEPHVVKLKVTQRRPDLFRPWTKASPAKTAGSGVVMRGGKILTNAHVVAYASEVLVQLQRGGDQLPATVTAAAPGIDLAVVELRDPSAVADLPGLEVADGLAEVKSRISAYGYPTGGDDLSVTDGIVSRIEFAAYYYGALGVRIQVDAALNPGNSGGPAIQDSKIAGLVFSKIAAADNIGYLIPPEEIRSFLDDVADGDYQGNPLLHDLGQTAENPALRAFLKLPSDVTGIVIKKPYSVADDYPLRRWDVITHVGPHSIDNQGYVSVREGLRLRFMYYVTKLAVDGVVPLTVFRDGESIEVKAPVRAKRELLVPPLERGYPEYFIYGPLVFTAATQELVGVLGSRGMGTLISLENPLVSRLTDPPAEPGEQMVLIAARMFPHRIIRGYDNRPLGVITKVNDVKIRNLRHLAETLQSSDSEFLLFDVAGRSESYVFRRDEMEAATEEILVDEGIRYQASKNLRDIWRDP